VKLNWTNVNFVLVEGVIFDGQTCFFGHGCEMFAGVGGLETTFDAICDKAFGRGRLGFLASFPMGRG
jgi:hypothetical protein